MFHLVVIALDIALVAVIAVHVRVALRAFQCSGRALRLAQAHTCSNPLECYVTELIPKVRKRRRRHGGRLALWSLLLMSLLVSGVVNLTR